MVRSNSSLPGAQVNDMVGEASAAKSRDIYDVRRRRIPVSLEIVSYVAIIEKFSMILID